MLTSSVSRSLVPLLIAAACTSIARAQETVAYFYPKPDEAYQQVMASHTVVFTGRVLDSAESQCLGTEFVVQQVVVIPDEGPAAVTEVILYGRSTPVPAGSRAVHPQVLPPGDGIVCALPCLPAADVERWPQFPGASDCNALDQLGVYCEGQID